MSEIEAMQAIEGAFSNLKHDEQERVLVWAASKYAKSVRLGADASLNSNVESSVRSRPKKKKEKKNKSSPMGGAGKKVILTMDKSLNLTPSGKKSANEFIIEKKPTNVKEKCVVAAY